MSFFCTAETPKTYSPGFGFDKSMVPGYEEGLGQGGGGGIQSTHQLGSWMRCDGLSQGQIAGREEPELGT